MRTLGHFIAGVCAILFIITGVLALLFFNIERKAFSSETYKQAFERLQLYNRMPRILADSLTTVIAQNQLASTYLKSFTVQNWESAISTLIPPEEMKALANSTLDSTFDYLNYRTHTAVISLLPFKSHLVGPTAIDAILQLLNTQPVCTVDQIIELTFAALSGGDLIFCNPPPEAVEVVRPLIQSQLQTMAVAIPNEVTLISTTQPGTPQDPRSNLRLARSIMQITPLFPLAFLLGLTIFAVRSLVDWLKWWGWPFLLTGLASILIAIPGASVFGYVFQLLMARQGFGFLPPLLLGALRETVSAIVDEILGPVAFVGFALAGIGLLMVLVGAILGYRQRERTIPRWPAR
ncbi:MAG TPA: hypothetical protein VJ821_19275 [Anaerolineales bacterium]|nr:hypothetical protein [Anaerolineales bacterium]